MTLESSESEPFSQRVIQVRHDLRNPLAHIMGFSELLQEAGRNRDYTESLEDLRHIEKECERMIVLIRDTLNESLEEATADVGALVNSLREFTTDVLERGDRLMGHARGRSDEHFITDLERIDGAAKKLRELVDGPLVELGGG